MAQGNNKCASCGQFAGRGHVCPTTMPQTHINPNHNFDFDGPVATMRDNVADRTSRAETVIATMSTPPSPPTFPDVNSYDAQVAAWEATGLSTSDAQATVDACYLQAERYEAEAKKHFDEKQASWERSDTDGFLSQWASDLNGQKNRLEAQIAEQGGVDEFPVLLKDGKPVPAFVMVTHPAWNYGRPSSTWAVFASAEEANSGHGDIIEWVGLGDKAMAKKGYTRGAQIRPAKADLAGEDAVNVRAIIKPADHMRFNPDAPLIQN